MRRVTRNSVQENIEDEVIFCMKCGTKNKQGSRFCGVCGNPIAQNNSVPINYTYLPAQNAATIYAPVRKKPILWRVVVFILGLILLVWGVHLVLSGTDQMLNSSRKNNTQDKNIHKNYQIIEYEKVARDPNTFKGKPIVVSGTVIQVSEATFFGTTTVTLRVSEDGTFGDKIWYVKYSKNNENESRILDNDFVTIYGTCNGVETYTAILGNQITIPSINADKIELKE